MGGIGENMRSKPGVEKGVVWLEVELPSLKARDTLGLGLVVEKKREYTAFKSF